MRCPLPIDWLEYVEGTSSEELTVHLRECRPCRLLVEDFRRELADRPKLRIERLQGPWPRWQEARSASPAFGEIWWSARTLGSSETPMALVPLLIASDPWQEGDRYWFDVIPLSTDIESATALDLVLARSDTDLEVPLRVFLRHQSVAERGELGARIGTLTEAGRTVLKDLIAGRAPEERFGSPIEAPYDERIRLPEDVESSVRLLGQTYARMLEHETSDEKLGRVLVFERRSSRYGVAKGSLSLAADTGVMEEDIWVVESAKWGHIQGMVEYRHTDDELLFTILDVTEKHLGLLWVIVLWSDRLLAPLSSQPFVPVVGERVSLGRDYGVMPREISRLELRAANEE